MPVKRSMMLVFMIAGLLCDCGNSLTLQAIARQDLAVYVLAVMSGAQWSVLSRQPAWLQAASKAMREREAALLTVQAMEADLARKRSALSSFTQGQQVSPSWHRFCEILGAFLC